MKKLLVFIVFPLFLSCSLLSGLIEKKPEISLKRFDIDSISLKDITFLFEIALNNPYPVGFKLEDVGFNVRVEENQVFKTRTKKGVMVKAGGREVTPVTVNLKYADVIRLIKDYTERESLTCDIDIDVVIPLPKAVQSIKKNITFKHTVEKQIPALKPTFRIANFEVKAPTLTDIKSSLAETGKKNLNAETVFRMFGDLISGKDPTPSLDLTSLDVPIRVSFDAEVKNNTRAKLGCRDLSYDFFVSDAKILSGSTKDIKNEGNLSVIRITNTFSSKALGKSVVNMLSSRKGTYQLKGFSNLKLPDEIKREPLKLDFDEKGSFTVR
ncbi:MAG: hypothetical protein JW807_13970 [Spirochaetes bacterium]|nr:hypothetical protein [Spirochaetota bacterium]